MNNKNNSNNTSEINMSGGGGGGGGSYNNYNNYLTLNSHTNSLKPNISDDALLHLSVKDLNKLLKSLPHDERNKLKRRRRILKNRGYAANCRTKRMTEKERLQYEKNKLESDVRKMSHQNEMLKVKLDSIKSRYSDLQNYAKVFGEKKASSTATSVAPALK